MGLTGFDRLVSGKQTRGPLVEWSLNKLQTTNGKTQSDRVTEGEAILASVFGEVELAA